MLLNNNEYSLEDLDYSNMYISVKRDGIRAQITTKGINGRSLKEFKNSRLNVEFSDLINSLDDNILLEAEIYADGIPCREIAGICNSSSKELPPNIKLYIFGMYSLNETFSRRYSLLKEMATSFSGDNWSIVEQNRISSAKEATEFYNLFISDGYEGAVLMDGSKKYKCGRVTIKEHIGFKMKPEREDDLEILNVTERMENTNESLTNELGHSYKRNTVDAKEHTGIAATFICKLPNGKECGVTITGHEEYRRDVWKYRDDFVGRYAVVTSMDYGTKDKLRHPRLKSIKETCEK